MQDKQRLIQFLQKQEAMAISTTEPYIANIFYSCSDEGIIYFISSKDTKHSQQILTDPKIAFSVIWYNQQDHTDRKGVQGIGTCSLCENEEDIILGTKLHNNKFPTFARRLTPQKAVAREFDVWKIIPETIKYWDDKAYAESETRTIIF